MLRALMPTVYLLNIDDIIRDDFWTANNIATLPVFVPHSSGTPRKGVVPAPPNDSGSYVLGTSGWISLASGLTPKGTWNANTNSPTIPAAGAGNAGWYYVVATAGTTNIDDVTDWQVGDWIVSNGSVWQKIDQSDQVVSVAGLTGVISANALKSALSLNNVDNTSDANKPISIDQQAALDLKAPLASAALTGTPTATTASASDDSTRIATTAFVQAVVSAAVAGLLDLKGNIDASSNPNYPAASKGDAYFVSVAGKVGGGSGTIVAVGDLVVAKLDNAGGTQASVGTSWFVLEKNLDGALVAANNLSDLTSPSTARSNLGASTIGSNIFVAADAAAVRSLIGLVLGTDVQAYRSELTKVHLKGSNLASGTTVDLGAATGDYAVVTHSTGTTAISSFGTVAAGTRRSVVFNISGGTLTLTHHTTQLNLPSAANITITECTAVAIRR